MRNEESDYWESLDYPELELELSKTNREKRVEVLSNILCQEFYLISDVDHIKKVLLILLRLEDGQ